ncbi:MAG: hybrid sensor histidine kinase/response regulator [Planctomycetota bacterium]|jgi:PAS domain S-box-containing protein
MMIVIAMTVVVTCLGGYEYRRDVQEQVAGLRAELSTTIDRLTAALATTLWDLNTEEIKSVVVAEMANDSIVAIEIHERFSDEALVELGRDESWNALSTSTASLAGQAFATKRAEIRKAGETIGYVRVTVTDRFTLAEIRSRMGRFLLKMGVLLLIEVLCLIAIIQREVVRPIALLDAAVSDSENERAAQGLNTDRKDEIGRLARSFISMRGRIGTLFAERDSRIAELESARRELQISEDRLRTLVSNIPGASYRCAHDEHWTIEFLSDAAEALTGYPASDFIANRVRSFASIIHPEDAQSVQDSVAAAVARREPFSLEYRIVHADGDVRWVLERGQGVFGEGADPICLDGVIVDVTERKRAAEELRESEALLNESQAIAHVGSWQLDLVSDHLVWSDETYRIFGRSPQEFEATYEAFLEAVHPDDRAAVDEAYSGSVRNGKGRYEIEHRVVQKDTGQIRHVREQCRHLRDASGKIVRSVGMVRDITERRLAERELAASTEMLSLHVARTPVGVIGWNLAFEVAEWNPAAERMFGYTREEALGRHCAFIVPEEAREQVDDVWRGLLTRSGGERSDNENITKDGRRISCQWYNTPLVDAQGQVIGVASFVMDVTDHVKLEAQLRHAQKMDAIGQLAGGVAHDFNNLLAAIMGNAELLEMTLPSESSEVGYAKEIVTASSRAAELTKQLLAFSRKGLMRTANVDMHSIITEVVALLDRSIDKRIKIVQRLEASPAVVSGDLTQLHSAILNLAVNARDAMPEGGELTLSTRSALLDESYCAEHGEGILPGHYVEIAVTDTGVGMEDDVQSHVFEPFFTTKEQGAGTGLGLASVYGCVKNHEGTIRVYSEPGRGSTFKVLLPLSPEASTDAAVDRQAPIRGHGHILVVDDEETVRRFTHRALTHLGYRVSCCSDGDEAVEFFRETHGEIDLVILDLIMPKLSGDEVFNLLKAIDPDVRVLIASGFTRNGTADALIDNGALGFLNKPYRIDELSRKVARHLPARA